MTSGILQAHEEITHPKTPLHREHSPSPCTSSTKSAKRSTIARALCLAMRNLQIELPWGTSVFGRSCAYSASPPARHSSF